MATVKRYVRRDQSGKFEESHDVGRSLGLGGGRYRQGRSLGRATKTIVSARSALASARRRSRSCPLPRRCAQSRLLAAFFSANMLRQTFSTRLAIPLFEGLVRDLPFDEQRRGLATLRLTLERHETLLKRSGSCSYRVAEESVAERGLRPGSREPSRLNSCRFAIRLRRHWRDLEV
jgi:hypothetical protein